MVAIELQIAVLSSPGLRRRRDLTLERAVTEGLLKAVAWVVVQGRDAGLEDVRVRPDRRGEAVAYPPDRRDGEDVVKRELLVSARVRMSVRSRLVDELKRATRTSSLGTSRQL